jgi:hypothetical protein
MTSYVSVAPGVLFNKSPSKQDLSNALAKVGLCDCKAKKFKALRGREVRESVSLRLRPRPERLAGRLKPFRTQ